MPSVSSAETQFEPVHLHHLPVLLFRLATQPPESFNQFVSKKNKNKKQETK